MAENGLVEVPVVRNIIGVLSSYGQGLVRVFDSLTYFSEKIANAEDDLDAHRFGIYYSGREFETLDGL